MLINKFAFVHRTLVWLIAASLLLAAGEQGAAAQTPSRYFSETGHTVEGKFLDYWQANGGLSQFGYPISEELPEVSALNQQTYTVQYFERAEFELHPENQPPYDVLLTQLGSLRLRAKYPSGTPTADPNPGSRYFPETGHNLRSLFLPYWQNNGGLERFGYPLTEEFDEESPIDGKPYVVQYFERAEFEWHPENQAPYDVLLTQLGRFEYEQRYQQAAPPVVLAGSHLLTQAASSSVAAYGHYVFWITTDHSVYGYDINTQKSFIVKDKAAISTSYALTTDGKEVFWTENELNHGTAIYSYEIDNQQLRKLTSPTLSAVLGIEHMVADNGTLFYEIEDPAARTGNGIYAYDLTTNTDSLIAPEGRDPVAGSGTLLWMTIETQYQNLFIYTLHVMEPGANAKDKIIVSSPIDFSGYGVSGNRVVWSEEGYGSDGVHIYDISNGNDERIASDTSAIYPVIHDNKVVWSEDIAGGTMIYYNLDSGISTKVETAAAGFNGVVALVDQNTLVYTVFGPGLPAKEIYTTTLP